MTMLTETCQKLSTSFSLFLNLYSFVNSNQCIKASNCYLTKLEKEYSRMLISKYNKYDIFELRTSNIEQNTHTETLNGSVDCEHVQMQIGDVRLLYSLFNGICNAIHCINKPITKHIYNEINEKIIICIQFHPLVNYVCSAFSLFHFLILWKFCKFCIMTLWLCMCVLLMQVQEFSFRIHFAHKQEDSIQNLYKLCMDCKRFEIQALR